MVPNIRPMKTGRPIRTPIWLTESRAPNRRSKTTGACEGHRHTTAAGLLRGLSDGPFRHSRKWASSAAFKRCSRSIRKTASTARAARGPIPTASGRWPSSAKTARRPSPPKRPTKRLTPEVFARHPISEMLKQRDVWLDELGRITHPMVRRKGSDHLRADLLGRRLRTRSAANCARSPRPTRRRFTPRVGPATKRPSCTVSSPGSSARTICPTAPTCATNRAAPA